MEHIKNGIAFSDMDVETQDKLIKELVKKYCIDPCDPCKEEIDCNDSDHFKNRGKGYDKNEVSSYKRT